MWLVHCICANTQHSLITTYTSLSLIEALGHWTLLTHETSMRLYAGVQGKNAP